MKIHDNSTSAFNINVIGAWNQAIFSPEWVKANLAEDKERDVMMAMSFPVTAAPVRITVDSINIYPSAQILTLDAATVSDELMATCASKFRQIAALLPHTPVTGMGINFRFVGSVDDSAGLAELFTFPDAGNIDAAVFRAVSASIKRGFALADGRTLFLTLENANGMLTVEFNFHGDVRTVEEMSNYLTPERPVQLKKMAIDFLSNVYDIDLELAQ
jgi:hypothetical protein